VVGVRCCVIVQDRLSTQIDRKNDPMDASLRRTTARRRRRSFGARAPLRRNAPIIKEV
jgi:hypothetical protein